MAVPLEAGEVHRVFPSERLWGIQAAPKAGPDPTPDPGARPSRAGTCAPAGTARAAGSKGEAEQVTKI